MLDKTKPYGRKRGTCAGCGGMIWRGSTSLPEGQAKCLACRRQNHRVGDTYYARTKHERLTPCVDCGGPCLKLRCWPCSVAARPRGKGKDRDKRLALNRRRQALLNAAPGLTQRERYALLAEWKRQGRECAYCPALATSLDHVVPVSRGGSNYEDNLVPACLSCNGSKNGLTLEEWMHEPRTRSAR